MLQWRSKVLPATTETWSKQINTIIIYFLKILCFHTPYSVLLSCSTCWPCHCQEQATSKVRGGLEASALVSAPILFPGLSLIKPCSAETSMRHPSLPEFAVSEVTLVAWNQRCQKHLHQRNQETLKLSHLSSGLLVVKLMCMLSHFKSCPPLCNPMDCSPPGSSVYGISQTRILEWVAIPISRSSSWPRDGTCISFIGRWILYHGATQEAHCETHTKALSEPLLLPPISHLCFIVWPKFYFLNENLRLHRVVCCYHLISQQPFSTLLASPVSCHMISWSCCVPFSWDPRGPEASPLLWSSDT